MSAFSPRRCVQHYRDTGLQARVSEAGPHQLIALLLEGACQRIGVAQACLHQDPLNAGDIARKGQAIAKACTIIAHLNQSLDHSAGGEIATHLSALYNWLLGHLTKANADNDPAALQDALDVLEQIRSAWAGIANTPASMAA